MRRKLRTWLFFLLSYSVVFCFIQLWYFSITPFKLEKDVIFYIPPKTTIYHLTAYLMDKNILKNPHLFLVLGYLKNAANHLQKGEYQLEVGITPNQCLNRFKKGKVKLHRFTLVEGWTYQKLSTILKQDIRFKNHLNSDFFNMLRKEFSFNTDSLEGLFLPESYDFPRDTPASEILKRAFFKMQYQLNVAWNKRASDLPWKNPYEALIAASLVEKETASEKERAKIAGVIIRRLKKNIPLQIDASVVYGLAPRHKGPLRKYELKIDTPYNTYTRKGLPPSPIAMPSLRSIEAVLNPDLAGNYLYFVVKDNKEHTFSEKLKDHLIAVKRYRKSLKKK